jgi:hypothetical protein
MIIYLASVTTTGSMKKWLLTAEEKMKVFGGGETRHWIQDVTSPGKEKEKYENISCRRSPVERGTRQVI